MVSGCVNNIKSQIKGCSQKLYPAIYVVFGNSNQDDENEQNIYPGEFEGEEYGPQYMCMKREVPEEDVCISKASSCTEARTTTGNILERLVVDPYGRRPPCLSKWPTYCTKSEANLRDNVHQFKAAQQPTIISQMCSLRVTSEPHDFKQPAIVATLRPTNAETSYILELIEAGANILQVTLANENQCFPSEIFQNIIEASNQFKALKDFEVPIAIMVDLKCHEIRTGKVAYSHKTLKPKEIFLQQGTKVKLTTIKLFEQHCSEKIIYFNYEEPLKNLDEGMTIYIGEEGITLKVKLVEALTVDCEIEVGGQLLNEQRVIIPHLPVTSQAMSDFDLECLEMAIKMDADIIVIPKTRNEDIVKQVRKAVDSMKEENDVMILASLCSFEGLENIDSIIKVADGVIIKKNDLSMDVPSEKIFVAQKEIIAKCNRVGKPVFCTGQLSFLKSCNNVLKRVEVNDIAGAIIDGADGIILTNETMMYDFGVPAVTQLSRIIKEAEAVTMQKPFHFDLVDEQIPAVEPSKAIAMAAVQIANKIQAAAILTVTTSGKTAQMLSWFRPRKPVIAITRVGKTARQLNLFRAVLPLHFTAPVLSDWFHDVKARLEYGVSYGRECGIIKTGDLLVLVTGFRKKAGFTNCIRIVFASLEKNSFMDNFANYYVLTK